MMIRDMVTIDEDLCNGCGQCVPACAEGAIQIIDGKAKLVSDRLCDGLGACLGHCPQDAIRIEKREAVAFDEAAVEAHLEGQKASGDAPPSHAPAGGCPGARMASFDRRGSASAPTGGACSELTHWPVQLKLLPATAPALHGAHLLIAADCVPVAMADFHAALLRDHAVVIACPKLDDPTGYVEKLADIIRLNNLAEVSVARMEVPCCGGLTQMVRQARQLSGCDVPITEIQIGVQGDVLARRPIPAESTKAGSNAQACCPDGGGR